MTMKLGLIAVVLLASQPLYCSSKPDSSPKNVVVQFYEQCYKPKPFNNIVALLGLKDVLLPKSEDPKIKRLIQYYKKSDLVFLDGPLILCSIDFIYSFPKNVFSSFGLSSLFSLLRGNAKAVKCLKTMYDSFFNTGEEAQISTFEKCVNS
ncbi:unnamed protein product [Callosobruchus maculatus]|uniref:Uncharacterized protein n=1 Tax=Callosobruchus maculatus TaxID=64391 RepID=A0A653CSE9_CALMS|nr:unnamed protein product [Callosobruchus maculatus]